MKNELQTRPFQTSSGGIFSREITKTNHPTLILTTKINVHKGALRKHLGTFLDCKLNFEEHFKTIVNKINRTTGLLREFQNFLPRKFLLAMYKSFIWPHLDYSDITYDQNYNTFFPSKTGIASIQCSVSHNRCHWWYFERKTF